jgi:hypothetical protein
MIKSIIRSNNRHGAVKVYARVASRSRASVDHLVTYVRTVNVRGWLCGCENFLFSAFAKNRNCAHIREVRKQYGRYGAKVS